MVNRRRFDRGLTVWSRKSSTPKPFKHLLLLFIVAVDHTYFWHCARSLAEKRAMTRLLFTTLLCALGTAQALAQTAVSPAIVGTR